MGLRFIVIFASILAFLVINIIFRY